MQTEPTSRDYGATRLAGRLFDLLLPTVCAACGKLGPVICPSCQSSFSEINGPGCLRCGRPQPQTRQYCAYCRSADFKIQQARACYAYKEPLDLIIRKLKYEGLFSLAEPLGQLMARKWPRWDHPPDLIVPIPLHARRQRVRGFNQANLLALQLAPAVGLEVNIDALHRVRNTKPQVGLTPLERRVNVSDAFAVREEAILGKRILLVDDVFTTGATMNSAANTLLRHGAKGVAAYCLAQALQ